MQYTARSFGGGKKVRFFRDPPTWIWACLRFRFSPLPRQGRESIHVANRDDRHLAHPDPKRAMAQGGQSAVGD